MPRKFPEEFTRFDLITNAMESFSHVAESLQPFDKDDPRVKQGLEWGEMLLTELRGYKPPTPEIPKPTTGSNTVPFPRKRVQ